MSKPKHHWWLLSFMVQSPGAWVPTSFLHAREEMLLDIGSINKAKEVRGMANNSVLLSASYMGYCNDNVIQGLPEIDPPTTISDSYREGVIAATLVPYHDPNQPVNPYVNADGSVIDEWASGEWSTGFQSIRAAQQSDISTVKRIDVTAPPQQASESVSLESLVADASTSAVPKLRKSPNSPRILDDVRS